VGCAECGERRESSGAHCRVQLAQIGAGDPPADGVSHELHLRGKKGWGGVKGKSGGRAGDRASTTLLPPPAR
jgi:hypothetical protein